MKRRTVLAAALAAPLALPIRRVAAAERLIGWISPESQETTAPFFNAFKAGLQASLPRGAEPVRIIERYVAGGADAMPAQASELQALGVRLIVTQGTASVPVAKAKLSVPIVFGFSGDPVVAGIADSLARPGGNATGMSFMSIELNPKRVDFLRTALPDCRKVALLSNARHAGEEAEIVACQQAVERVGIELAVHRVRGAAEIPTSVAQALDGGAQALLMLPSSLMVQHASTVATQCLARKVPLVSGWASIARAGALLTYGPNFQQAYNRIAFYVVRILGGAAASSLPIEQPTVFELVINMKTAAALGVTLPPSLLVQADEVIE